MTSGPRMRSDLLFVTTSSTDGAATRMSHITKRSVRTAAIDAARLLAGGEPLKHVWRHAVLQMFDDYASTLRHDGVQAAAALWHDEPAPTGDSRVDAALAALAEHLARRDGWPVPAWALAPSRVTDTWWFVTDLPGLHPRALVESPLSFRKRGVFITADALVRV